MLCLTDLNNCPLVPILDSPKGKPGTAPRLVLPTGLAQEHIGQYFRDAARGVTLTGTARLSGIDSEERNTPGAWNALLKPCTNPEVGILRFSDYATWVKGIRSGNYA